MRGEDRSSRDPGAIAAGICAWLRDRRGAETDVSQIRSATVGFSSDTYFVDLRTNGVEDRLVLKLPPSGPGIFANYDFTAQARVQEVVAAAGVPAPVPAHVELNEDWLGAPFLVMPAIKGTIIDEIPVRDPWLRASTPELNADVYARYLEVIAGVNRIDWQAAGLIDVVPQRNLRQEVDHWRGYLGWAAEGAAPLPVLLDALDWCDANRPRTEAPPSLLWGDVRLGNVIFDDRGVPAAVLDWEMASIGAAEHDLAWSLALQSMQDSFFRPVPGFLDQAGATRFFEERLGREVNDYAWYEMLAIVRSTAIMVRISHLQERSGGTVLFPVQDNPVVKILQSKLDAGG